MKFRNENKWQHRCRNGTVFTCERCDFRSDVLVENYPQDAQKASSDVAEMIGFHAVNIYPELNGFAGYDNIKFVFITKSLNENLESPQATHMCVVCGRSTNGCDRVKVSLPPSSEIIATVHSECLPKVSFEPEHSLTFQTINDYPSEKPMKVAINSFVRRQTPESSFSHFEGTEEELLNLIEAAYLEEKVSKGYREGVILVEVPPQGFFTGIVELKNGDKLVGEFESRVSGESPRKSVKVLREDNKKTPAQRVQIVLYSHEVLSEDNSAQTNADFEVIAINAHPTNELAPIAPNTLMHNHFVSDGGTATNMTAEEFESQMKESFEYWKNKAMLDN